MKTIIAGSRKFDNWSRYLMVNMIDASIKESGFLVTEVVSGGAKGIDIGGELWAEREGIPVQHFLPDWEDLTHPKAVIKTNRYGKKYDAMAGKRRNLLMAEYAQALVAIWDGKSPGTRNMIDHAKKLGLEVYVKKGCVTCACFVLKSFVNV